MAANDRGEGAIATDAQIPGKPKPVETHVTLPDGKRVPNPYSKTGYLISPVADLSPVAEAGRQAGAIYQEMLASHDPDIQQAALPQFVASIGGAISQGGTFDYQRTRADYLSRFMQLPQFRDVSNFNVGLYMQQTGQFSQDDTLSLAGTFARYFSSNYMPDRPYVWIRGRPTSSGLDIELRQVVLSVNLPVGDQLCNSSRKSIQSS